MEINQVGIDLIKSFEGLRLTAYRDVVGIPTVGYGHCGPDVKMGLSVTPDKAEQLLHNDLERFCHGVEAALGDTEATESQFSAMVCLAYNIGLGNFTKSHLLSKFLTGDLEGAADQFLRWSHAGGVEVPGLLRRRQAERTLFLSVTT